MDKGVLPPMQNRALVCVLEGEGDGELGSRFGTSLGGHLMCLRWVQFVNVRVDVENMRGRVGGCMVGVGG